ncbi:hypothetical protein D5018_06045 [Parashewanella curva]|uniref:Cardiolipin synthase N-terminal domain-containing protein n=1 Tax=Parashewanella curva TaxID=2338552 RepID=A0A3L8PZS1_9GAMM|nr:hypothetical protein D5018_06045 [Parashewanella curva]
MASAYSLYTIILLGILLTHACFAIGAAVSSVRLTTPDKILWSLISLSFGPLGYYAYRVTIPYELIVEPEQNETKY